ncbi:hypothetical protein OUZ56_018872 [Daphnia magna]|uniref:Uncharacterized protein n=1 Tax=Daphnia magna TaxID=35525 RepID=A0ABQ9ZA17_9CRUS|nr:hypothetical protein OUZ56_018872 [Daphnia magna]
MEKPLLSYSNRFPRRNFFAVFNTALMAGVPSDALAAKAESMLSHILFKGARVSAGQCIGQGLGLLHRQTVGARRVLFLLADKMSTAVLNARSILAEEYGIPIISFAIGAKAENLC